MTKTTSVTVCDGKYTVEWGPFAALPATASGGWQDIETAPKDGTEIIACWGRQGDVMQIVRFDRIHKVWMTKGDPILGFKSNVTHWMPLPAAPTITRKSKSEEAGS
jgi:predicted lipoprotein with Yx(FWY)xxD motif